MSKDAVEMVRELLEGDRKTAAALQKKIDKLQEKLDAYKEAEREEEFEREWQWTRHRRVDADAYPAELPVPRLQLEFIMDEDGYNAVFRYDLIYRHYATDDLIAIPLGLTKSCGAPNNSFTESFPEPWREAIHIRSDAAQMGLPAFKVYDGKWARLSTLEAYKKTSAKEEAT